jgi:beta-lactam-binding protein with PASTA domain/predicted Ser/Thr protein kinase
MVGMDSVNDKPRVLGNRYEVGDLLGRGGMAEVHIGRDTRLGRVVAIKLLRTDLARDATFQARFRREAQSAAALNHPAIVAVYDTGEEQVVEAGGSSLALPYIVMEYVEGRTLRELMHDGRPLDVDTALEVTARVLSALEYSHRSGIVHRDIKPANVMMTTTGDVKVMDFGIARALADASSTMTQTQAVIGTAQYLSPEQARGETVDARSDLYSAGCLLYEVLTGRPPFVADSPVAVAYQHVREEPQPPSVFNPAVPPAVDRIVLHALAKDRETRYQTAAEFRADIEAALAGRPISAVAAGAAAGAAGAATTQFLGAPGAGTRTMQNVTEPVPPAYGGTAVAPPVGGGMLPGAPVEEEYGYSRRDRAPEPARTNRTGTYVLLALAILLVAGLVAYTISKMGGGGTPAPTKIAVPSVVNTSVDDAKKALADKGFTNVVVRNQNHDEPKDTVFAQKPDPNTSILPTDTITLSVSLGKGQVAVPPLEGLTQDEAFKRLQDADLTPAAPELVDDPQHQKNEVTKSDPPAGTTVDKGTAVKLFVASGKIDLPNLRNKDLAVAVQALTERSLKYSATYVPGPAGVRPNTVLTMSPGPGTVAVGSRVRLTVAQAASPSPSPSESPSPSPSASPSPSTTP